MSKEIIETESKEEEVNLDEILGTPGAGAILTPEESEKKEGKEEQSKGFFSSSKKSSVDEFLDNLQNGDNEDVVTPEEKYEKEKDTKEEVEEKKEEPNKEVEAKEKEEIEKDDLEEPVKKKAVSETKDSPQYVGVLKSLLDKGIIKGYNEIENPEDYTEEDFNSLIQDNIRSATDGLKQDVINEFYNNLPEEFQKAYEYYANGGSDTKSFLRTVSAVADMKGLDTDNEHDQKTIIREYLKSKDWGTDEEIEDEINDLDDRGDLKKKAEKYKPLLDQAQDKIIEQKMKAQEKKRQEKIEARKMFDHDVKEVLSQPDLNGIELDSKTRDMIYVGLMDASYDSINGNKTNKLGALLERYQYGKNKDLSLVAECLWLMDDPTSYRKHVVETIRKAESQKTMRTLKTEQQSSKNNTAASVQEEKERNTIPRRGEVKKAPRGFFDFSN